MLDSIFGWLFDLLAGLWNALKAVLPYLLIAAAMYLAFTTGALSLSWLIPGLELQGVGAALALGGLSFLFAPGETAEVFSKTAQAMGDAASSVVGAGVDVLTSGVGALLTSPVVLVAGGAFLLWFLASKKRRDDAEEVPA